MWTPSCARQPMLHTEHSNAFAAAAADGQLSHLQRHNSGSPGDGSIPIDCYMPRLFMAALTVEVQVDGSKVLSQLRNPLRDAAGEVVAAQRAKQCKQTRNNY